MASKKKRTPRKPKRTLEDKIAQALRDMKMKLRFLRGKSAG